MAYVLALQALRPHGVFLGRVVRSVYVTVYQILHRDIRGRLQRRANLSPADGIQTGSTRVFYFGWQKARERR